MSRRSGNSRGGMQSAGVHPSIYCQVCEKPAARYEPRVGWMHFTKTGSVWHKEKPDQNPNVWDFEVIHNTEGLVS